MSETKKANVTCEACGDAPASRRCDGCGVTLCDGCVHDRWCGLCLDALRAEDERENERAREREYYASLEGDWMRRPE